ncbi:MAG: phytoene/squalene synthase family protein [Pseudomonadota bacterium]|nr:phytoene/squalene synthase family protein [Pseudomonadota bacterium]
MVSYFAEEAYQTHILQGVSRTFALTIPQLPPGLRQVVGNGYLLCRITDTIEDEPQLTPEQKRNFSQEFVNVIAGEACPKAFSQALLPLLSEATLAAEKDLIEHTACIIRLTHGFSVAQQAALLRCVRIMAQGMADFQQHNSLACLPNLAEMNRYCYYVAGVVGEMLTELFCHYSPRIALQNEKLQPLAVSFGQGLQMTNILKDIWEDRQRGVCWLPRDVFTQVGCDLTQLLPHHYDPAFGAGLARLIALTHTHLHNALHYILLIPAHEQGIRRFCLWALGMAILTLRNINKKRDFSAGHQVKISRSSVQATIVVSNFASYSDNSLRLLFYLLTRTLPQQQTLSIGLANSS